MTTTADQVVRMANQFAANLAHAPDPAKAAADHIRAFWTPAMREAALAAPAGDFSDAARAVIERLRAS